jgi:hypothetical protein
MRTWHRFPMLLLVALVVACSPPVAGPPRPSEPATTKAAAALPARPRELPVADLDPCTLLTVEQRARLGVGEGRPAELGSGLRGPVCQWVRFPEEPQDAYLMTSDLRQGAEYALDSAAGARTVGVLGYPAVETQVGSAPPEAHCLLLVDIAEGQNLWVQYDYDGSTVPMTKQLACDKAKVAAELAVQTLIEQSGG